MVHAGIKSVLITSAIVTPFKIQRLLSLIEISSDVRNSVFAHYIEVICVCDSIHNANDLETEASRKNLQVKVLVDVDGGQVH